MLFMDWGVLQVHAGNLLLNYWPIIKNATIMLFAHMAKYTSLGLLRGWASLASEY